MIKVDEIGTVTVQGNERDVMSQFMVLCESIRNNIVSKHFDNEFEIDKEMLRIMKQVISCAEKRRK